MLVEIQFPACICFSNIMFIDHYIHTVSWTPYGGELAQIETTVFATPFPEC